MINTFIKDLNGVRLTIGYNVTKKDDGKVVLTGETNHCFTNSNLRPINLKKQYGDVYKKFEECLIKNNS